MVGLKKDSQPHAGSGTEPGHSGRKAQSSRQVKLCNQYRRSAVGNQSQESCQKGLELGVPSQSSSQRICSYPFQQKIQHKGKDQNIDCQPQRVAESRLQNAAVAAAAAASA